MKAPQKGTQRYLRKRANYTIYLYCGTGKWYVNLVYYHKDGRRARYQYYEHLGKRVPPQQRLANGKQLVAEIDAYLKAGYAPRSKHSTTQSPLLLGCLWETVDQLRQTLRPKTVEQYHTAVVRFEDWLKHSGYAISLEDFDAGVVLGYRNWLATQEQLNNTSRNTYLRGLSNVCTNAMKQGRLVANPVKGFERFQEEEALAHPFSAEELLVLKKELSTHYPELWLFCQLQFYCFIRPEELLRLRVSNIALAEGRIILGGSQTKNKRAGIIRIPDDWLEELLDSPLAELCKDPARANHYLFSKPHMRPGAEKLTYYTVRQKHKRICTRLGINAKCSLYSWKDTGAKYASKSGVKFRDLQNQLRHADLRTMEHYLRTIGEEASSDYAAKIKKL